MKENKAIKDNRRCFLTMWFIGIVFMIPSTIYLIKNPPWDDIEFIIALPVIPIYFLMMISVARDYFRSRHATSEAIGKIISVDTPLNNKKKDSGKSRNSTGVNITMHISFMASDREYQTKMTTYFILDGTNTPDEYIGKEVAVYYDPLDPDNVWPIKLDK